MNIVYHLECLNWAFAANSINGGDTWEESTYADEDQGGIFDLKVISTEGTERIFLALDKGGVYEVMMNTNEPQTIK